MQREDYLATLVVVIGYITATLTGFLRQITIAGLLGANRIADIYLVAFAIPEFVFIALPIILSPAFLPLFSKLRQDKGEVSAWQFTRRVLQILGLALIVITVLIALIAPIILTWISPGFSQVERREALTLFYPMLPGILFMGVATILATILQVYRRFFRSVIITTVYNLVFIISLYILPSSKIEIKAAWAVTLGAGAALLSLLPFWLNQTRAYSNETRSVSKAQIKEWSYLTFQLAIGYGLHHLIIFIDRAMATMLGPGSVAALSYADHLTLVITQISGLAVSTVIFPSLAEKVSGGDMKSAGQELASSITLVIKLALPACVGLMLLRTPVVQVLYERGVFDAQATRLVSAPILWYSIAVLADSLCQPLWRAVYARRSGWTVAAINGVQTTIRLFSNLLLVPSLGYVGLAISAAIGLIFQVILLSWWTTKTLGFTLSTTNWREIIKILIATSVAITISTILYTAMQTYQPLIIILVSSFGGAMVYFLILFVPKKIRRVIYGG